MSRATEYFYYINLKEKPSNEELKLYCNLTITPEIEKVRKELQERKETGLISKDDGSFLLF